MANHPGECSARERGGRMLRESGYETPSDKAADIHRITKAIDQHDQQLHGGKKTRLHLGRKRGGSVPGEEPMERPDRRARGGSTGKGKGKGKTVINIHAGGGEQGNPQREMMAHQAGIQQGAALGARAAAARMAPPGAGAPMAGGPPRPPMAMPPPGGAPGPGAPGMPPPGAMPPRPMMPPGGGGPMARGGAMMHRRDERGRFLGGAV